ncbi:hypothetical protein PVAG01_08635 [Phlyctema vagabunda]|uniref:Heterokaryon incompatibility domain-containing protein n=1 Tax=Phlyctema vagabunda TaxID=108571 RepID=A0ABR4P9Y7_9HELO
MRAPPDDDNNNNSSRRVSLVEKKEVGTVYEYQSLDTSRDEIRLLRLLPAASSGDKIHGKIFHTSLKDAPPYQALSYTWGDLNGSRPIFIDGAFLLATPNLRHALQRLRPKQGAPEVIIWVDAVCINQDDVTERGMQTGKMRKIYQHAKSVNVWLGLKNNDSDAALALAKDLHNCASETEVSDIVQDPARAEDIRALVFLFRRQYWWRIWVIQEVHSARCAMVYCGNHVIPWPALDRVCDMLKSEETHLRRLYYDSPSFIRTLVSGGPRGLQLSRFSPSETHAPPLLELLLSHKSKKSTDPKDKVYALVGISSSRNDFGPIDYKLSVREIYTHTARHIIQTSQRLDVICVRQHDFNQHQLPSWAPDWSRRSPSHREHTVIGLPHDQDEFAAAGETSACVTFSGDGYVLHTTGIILDTIRKTGWAFKRPGAQSESKNALRTFRQWWNLFIALKGDSLQAQAIFCRIISCGTWQDGDTDTYNDKLNAIMSLYNSTLSESTNRYMEPLPIDNSTDSIVVRSEEDYEKFRLATILSASLMMNQRRFVFSNSGIVGLAPWTAEEGDIICVLHGCRFPVVLRKEADHFILIGEAYIDGFIDGEALRGADEGRYESSTFAIH